MTGVAHVRRMLLQQLREGKRAGYIEKDAPRRKRPKRLAKKIRQRGGYKRATKAILKHVRDWSCSTVLSFSTPAEFGRFHETDIEQEAMRQRITDRFQKRPQCTSDANVHPLVHTESDD